MIVFPGKILWSLWAIKKKKRTREKRVPKQTYDRNLKGNSRITALVVV